MAPTVVNLFITLFVSSVAAVTVHRCIVAYRMLRDITAISKRGDSL